MFSNSTLYVDVDQDDYKDSGRATRIIVQLCTADARQFEQGISVRGDPPSAICSGGTHAVQVRNVLIAT